MSTSSKKSVRTFFVLAIILLIGLGVMTNSPGPARANSALETSRHVYLPIIRHSYPFTFNFVSWADTKSGRDYLADLSKQVDKLNPAFTMFPGDLESDGFTTAGMNAWKDAVNGRVSNGIFNITLPQRGNHDHNNTSGWQNYFNMAGTAERVGGAHFTSLDRNLSYSFDYGNARFIAIDAPGDATLIDSEELDYMDRLLTDAESRGLTHAFIFFHGPVYFISSHTSCPVRVCETPTKIVSLVKVLNKHPIVSAVFTGHEHLQAYVHLDSSRVPEVSHPFEQFITGSAGAELDLCNKPYRFDFCGSYHGFGLVRVSGKSFTVSIYRLGTASPVKTFKFTKP